MLGFTPLEQIRLAERIDKIRTLINQHILKSHKRDIALSILSMIEALSFCSNEICESLHNIYSGRVKPPVGGVFSSRSLILMPGTTEKITYNVKPYYQSETGPEAFLDMVKTYLAMLEQLLYVGRERGSFDRNKGTSPWVSDQERIRALQIFVDQMQDSKSGSLEECISSAKSFVDEASQSGKIPEQLLADRAVVVTSSAVATISASVAAPAQAAVALMPSSFTLKCLVRGSIIWQSIKTKPDINFIPEALQKCSQVSWDNIDGQLFLLMCFKDYKETQIALARILAHFKDKATITAPDTTIATNKALESINSVSIWRVTYDKEDHCFFRISQGHMAWLDKELQSHSLQMPRHFISALENIGSTEVFSSGGSLITTPEVARSSASLPKYIPPQICVKGEDLWQQAIPQANIGDVVSALWNCAHIHFVNIDGEKQGFVFHFESLEKAKEMLQKVFAYCKSQALTQELAFANISMEQDHQGKIFYRCDLALEIVNLLQTKITETRKKLPHKVQEAITKFQLRTPLTVILAEVHPHKPSYEGISVRTSAIPNSNIEALSYLLDRCANSSMVFFGDLTAMELRFNGDVIAESVLRGIFAYLNSQSINHVNEFSNVNIWKIDNDAVFYLSLRQLEIIGKIYVTQSGLQGKTLPLPKHLIPYLQYLKNIKDQGFKIDPTGFKLPTQVFVPIENVITPDKLKAAAAAEAELPTQTCASNNIVSPTDKPKAAATEQANTLLVPGLSTKSITTKLDTAAAAASGKQALSGAVGMRDDDQTNASLNNCPGTSEQLNEGTLAQSTASATPDLPGIPSKNASKNSGLGQVPSLAEKRPNTPPARRRPDIFTPEDIQAKRPNLLP